MDLVTLAIVETTLLELLTFLHELLTIEFDFFGVICIFRHQYLFRIDLSVLENFDHAVVPVSIDFPSIWNVGDSFHLPALDYSYADWNGLRDHLRDGWGRISLVWDLLVLCEWFQVGVDVYTSHLKCWIKPHLCCGS